VNRILTVLLLLLAVTAPAAAQQTDRPAQPAGNDTVLTPQERALQRLRTLGAVAQPDTAVVQQDTVRAQQVRVGGARPQTQAPAAIQRDSVMEALMGVRDYIATEYKGDSAVFNAQTSRLELRGQPQVAREGNNLAADSLIVYDERLAEACGYGQPVLTAAGMQNPLVSEVVCFDVERQIAFARNAQTSVAEGATWHLRGDVYFHGDDFYSHDAIFTDCDLPYPHYHYHFGAQRVKVVRDNVLVARNVTLNFADVPVFWLPFMVQSLSQGRRSGILMPRFGINDIARNSSRYNRRIEDVGFYWAMNDYMGAELSLDWFSNNWTALNGSLDFTWPQRFFRGGVTYRYFWPDAGGREFTIASSNSWDINERTSLNMSANYASSTRFVQQRSWDPMELNRSIDSNGSLRRRFDFGSTSLGVSRRQRINDATTDWTLPSVSFNISPTTLFEALPGDERWYSNLNWQGITSNVRATRRDVGAENTTRSQSNRNTTADISTGLGIGRLTWQQRATFEDAQNLERALPTDSTPVVLPADSRQSGRWSTGLDFQQRLMGTSTFTPNVSMEGQFARTDSSGNRLVHSPMRLSAGASLRTDLFGFWGGVGGFERFRHRFSPAFSYSYSPAVRADSLQRRVFSVREAEEQNRLTIGLSQTFEGRVRAAAGREGAQENVREADEAAAADTAPRRRERAQTINLLSINTDAVVYDFVRARRENQGIVTTSISNTIQSDLLRGLQLSFTHDLWRTLPPAEGGTPGARPDREFAPHLSNLNAAFALNANSWIFRVLGLGRTGTPAETPEGMPPMQETDPNSFGPATDRTRSEHGVIGTGRRTPIGGAPPVGRVGSWTADFTYSLTRPRDLPGGLTQDGSQMLTGRFAFQPTEMWSVRWNTGLNIRDRDFTDHVLTLTRRLHDWDANFDFIRAQNGNFSFQFRVHLRANPDIKLDYQQNDSPNLRR
jgi:lipopolysaccharide export system protein LptA